MRKRVKKRTFVPTGFLDLLFTTSNIPTEIRWRVFSYFCQVACSCSGRIKACKSQYHATKRFEGVSLDILSKHLQVMMRKKKFFSSRNGSLFVFKIHHLSLDLALKCDQEKIPFIVPFWPGAINNPSSILSIIQLGFYCYSKTFSRYSDSNRFHF